MTSEPRQPQTVADINLDATMTSRPIYRLENWAMVLAGDPYCPPEHQCRYLSGNVYGHPKFEDGFSIRTNAVLRADGRLVTTISGSLYQLGTIEPEYRDWIDKNYGEWDEENPIRLVEKLGCGSAG